MIGEPTQRDNAETAQGPSGKTTPKIQPVPTRDSEIGSFATAHVSNENEVQCQESPKQEAVIEHRNICKKIHTLKTIFKILMEQFHVDPKFFNDILHNIFFS